jgi:hypothetical protein
MRTGWFKESYRHSLAAKGIQTKTYWRKRYPELVKDFPGENPRITKNFARFRQEDPAKYDQYMTKGTVILGHNKYSDKWEKQSVMVPLSHKTSMAIIGFNPEQRERILRILANNPQLKSKVEALAEDIRVGTYNQGENRNKDISGMTSTYLEGMPFEMYESALNKAKLGDISERDQELLDQVYGKTLSEKEKHLERSRPSTIYLSSYKNPTNIKEYLNEYGDEEGRDKFWEYVIEHEVTHLAQERLSPGIIPQYARRNPNIPEISYSSPQVAYLANPIEMHPHLSKEAPEIKREATVILMKNSPTLQKRYEEYLQKLKKGNKAIRHGEKKWRQGEGEEIFDHPIPEAEAYANLKLLEQ